MRGALPFRTNPGHPRKRHIGMPKDPREGGTGEHTDLLKTSAFHLLNMLFLLLHSVWRTASA